MEPNDSPKRARTPRQRKQQTLAQALRFLTMASGQMHHLLGEISNLNSEADADNRLYELQNDMRALNSFILQKLSNAKFQMQLMKHEAVLRDLQKEKEKQEK